MKIIEYSDYLSPVNFQSIVFIEKILRLQKRCSKVKGYQASSHSYKPNAFSFLPFTSTSGSLLLKRYQKLQNSNL